LIATGIGLGIMFLTGCSDDNEKKKETPDAFKAKPDSGGSWMDEMQDAMDAFVVDDSILPNGDIVDENDVLDEDAKMVGNDNYKAKYISDMPCPFPASLVYDSKWKTLYTTCGGAKGILFKMNLYGENDSWKKMAEFDGYPSNHIELGDGRHLVEHSMPDGFTIIDENGGNKTEDINLSSVFVHAYDGNDLDFTPNNPSGAVLLSGAICIATSNLDKVDADISKTTFHKGTVICFPYDSQNGTVNWDASIAYFTSGKNPTGMALVDKSADADGKQRFAVLSSNSYAPESSGTDAYLDIFTWPEMNRSAIKLKTKGGKSITAQISPVLSITSGGVAVIGIQKPYPALEILNLNLQGGQKEISIPEVAGFISSIRVLNSLAAVSDFGGSDGIGSVVFVNFDSPEGGVLAQTVLNGGGGPSQIADGKLFQSVTSSNGGELIFIDMQ